jgi:hypothetical protein
MSIGIKLCLLAIILAALDAIAKRLKLPLNSDILSPIAHQFLRQDQQSVH